VIGWKHEALLHVANEYNNHKCILIFIFKKLAFSGCVDFKLNKTDGSPGERRSWVMSAAFL